MYAPGYAPGQYGPGHAPDLGATVTAEPSRGAQMPAAAARANWGAGFTRNCAGRADWQAVPGLGCAHRLRGACARRNAWRRLR